MNAQLSRLINQEGPAILAYAFKLTRSADDARDLAQESYRRALLKRDRFDRSRPIRPWCLTVLKNIHRDRRRSYESRHVVSLDYPMSGHSPRLESFIPDSRGNILEDLERQETVQSVRRTLKRMPVTQRSALMLCDMEGLRYSQAAQRLGVPLGTLRSRLHRARISFRRRYSDVGEAGIVR